MRTAPWAITVALMISGSAGPDEGGVTQEQFLRLIKSQQSSIRDVAFAFEGERKPLIPDEETNATVVKKFQGRYALRSDGATFLEHSLEYGGEWPVNHLIQAMIGGQGELAAWVTPTYLDLPHPPVRKTSSGPGSYFGPQSPETFQFLWRFQSLKGVSDFGYKFLGWEEVDGRRCAHVEFDPNPHSPGPVLQELWVDLERGAHPLRIRNSVDGQSIYLIDAIRLKEFTLPSGEKVWFPVSGRFQKYHHKGEYTREPTARTALYVLNGTLVFNQGLGDGVFHVKADRFRPAFKPSVAAERSKRQPVLDFAAAEKKLDEALADPARQKLAPDASQTTRDELTAGSVLNWGLGIGGAIALLIAGILVVRRAGGGAG